MPPTTQDVDWSLNSLLRVLDAHHITQALTYSLRGKFYDFVSGNTETMRAAEMHPNITGVATIDPRRYFGCEEEVERCVDMGFHVFRFFPDEQGWSIESLPFLRLCERMAEHQVAVLMPAGSWGEQTRMARLLEPFGFPVVAIGATFDVIAESIAVAARNEHFYVETSQMHIVDSISGFVREVGVSHQRTVWSGGQCLMMTPALKSLLGTLAKFFSETTIDEDYRCACTLRDLGVPLPYRGCR